MEDSHTDPIELFPDRLALGMNWMSLILVKVSPFASAHAVDLVVDFSSDIRRLRPLLQRTSLVNILAVW